MKKILATCAMFVLGVSTTVFALPIVDADSGVTGGPGTETLAVNFTLGEFTSSNIDLSAFNADIADYGSTTIASMGWTPNWYQNRARLRFHGWGWNKGGPTGPNTGGNPNPVPEPATLMLFGAGLIVLAGLGRRGIKK